MASVIGEASAIVTLVNLSARLSKALYDIASKFYDARAQIEAFGREVQMLGEILNQLQRFLKQQDHSADFEVTCVTNKVLEQCTTLFSGIDDFREKLYAIERSSDPGKARITFRGKTKWVFESSELQLLQAQVDSMKINMLLMMSLQCLQSKPR